MPIHPMLLRRHVVLAASGALIAALPATAQTVPDQVELPPIIISGGLTPIAADEYGHSVTVETGADLRDRGIETVDRALQDVPGVSVSGSDLSFGQIRIRGSSPAHTLVLVDGIEMINTDGGYYLANLDTSDVERIEVLRGPQSVFYGSAASAGVVAIWTRRGGEGLHYGGAVDAGGANGASGWISNRGARGGISAALSYRDDRGWDLSGEGGERDGLIRRSGRISADWKATDDLTLSATLLRSKLNYDYDPNDFAAVTADQYTYDSDLTWGNRDETSGQIAADWSMLDGRLTHRLSYDEVRDHRYVHDGTEFGFDYESETRRRALKYRLSYALDGQPADLSSQVVNLMVERVRDSSPDEPRYKRDAKSLAVEYRGELVPNLAVQLGVRHDWNSAFEDATTWTTALAYTFDNGVKLHASGGSGIVNPTYYQLFAATFGYVGNPDLRPERNESWDLGVTVPFASDRGSFDVTYFNERLKDHIIEVPIPGGRSFANDDGTAKRHGVEAALRWQASDQLALRGSLTLLSARNALGGRELRQPRRQASLGATWTTADRRGSVGGDLRHVGGMADQQFFGAYEVKELPAYTTLDVFGRWALSEEIALVGRIENVGDAAHVDSWGYASRGRTAYVGLSANF